MATRRRGADLSDLKSRLGLPEKPEQAAEPAPEEAPAAGTEDSPGETASDGGDAAPAAAPAAPAARPAAAPAAPAARTAAPAPADDEDYGAAVSAAEEEVAFQTTAEDIALDPETIHGKLPLGLLIAVAATGLIALVLGYLAGSVFDGRSVVNRQIAEAQRIQPELDALASTLSNVRNQLETIDLTSGVSNDFDRLLQNTWGEGAPMLPARSLTSSRTLMAYDPDLSRDLLNFSVETQLLNALVQQHLRLAERDRDEIQRELAGAEDDRNFAIIFNNDQQLDNFGTFAQADGEEDFTPERGVRVHYESLEIIPRDGGFAYNVIQMDGREIEVPIYNLVLLPREQLLEGATTDTATNRWGNRARAIAERVSAVAESQRRLRERITEIADRNKLFTI